jgi:hypothetical protein
MGFLERRGREREGKPSFLQAREVCGLLDSG